MLHRLEHVTPDLVRARPIWIGGEMDRPGRSSPDPCTDQFDLYLDRSMIQIRAGPIQTSADPDWQARRSGSGAIWISLAPIWSGGQSRSFLMFAPSRQPPHQAEGPGARQTLSMSPLHPPKPKIVFWIRNAMLPNPQKKREGVASRRGEV